MRPCSPSSFAAPSRLLREFASCKCLYYCSSASLISNQSNPDAEASKAPNSDSHIPDTLVIEKDPKLSAKAPVFDEINLSLSKPTSEDPILSQTHVVDSLLSFRDEPDSALTYYNWIQKHQGFLRGTAEPLCVLLHILMKSPTHHFVARELVSDYVARDSSPVAFLLFDHLVKCSEGFDFRFISSAFDALLSAYARAGRCKDAIDCFNAMLERDIVPTVFTINFVLHILIRKNMILEGKTLYNDIVSKGINYDFATVHIIMGASLKGKETEEALKYFNDAKASGVKLGAASYTNAIRIVCDKLDSEGAYNLLCEMKELGWIPSEGIFTKVICTCVKQRNTVLALRTKEDMLSCGHKMNLVVVRNLMKGYVLQADLTSALDLFEKIGEYGLSPDKVTFAVIIDGCCRHGNMEKALELNRLMELAGIQPNVYSLNSFIQGFFRARMPDEAMKQFNDAVEAGIANVFTYNIVLGCLCKEGKVNEAHGVWDKMAEKGVQASVISYNHMILGHCKKGNMDAALDLLSEMTERYLKASVVTYSILIDGYFEKGKTDQAMEIFDRMIGSGVWPNDFTFNIVVTRLSKVGGLSEVKDLLNRLITMGFNPQCMTYNGMIDGFMKRGDPNSALAIYKDMCDNGVCPNVVTYTVLIDGLCKSNNISLALKFLSEMRSKGIELDITAYNALIDGFCKRRDMDSARKLFDELTEVGLSPNAFVYNSMISGFRNIKNMEAALALHRQMIDKGIPSDLAIYTTLIDGLLKDGKLICASNVYQEMLEKGISPDEVTYGVLVHGLCNKGQMVNARKLLDAMQKKSFPPNILIYNTLISGYFREGNLQEAFKLHDEMLDRGLIPDDTTYDILVSGKLKKRSLCGSPS